MASSLEIYHGKVKRFDDIDLLIILSMMIDIVKDHKRGASDASLMAGAEHWEDQIEGYGPGLIRLELDEVLREKTAYDAFVSVLREIRVKLDSFGEMVPLEFIHRMVMFSIFARWKGPAITIRQPQPVDRLLKVVGTLEELIAG